jgi:TonB-dependent starch-binding outer membrane protein SusC
MLKNLQVPNLVWQTLKISLQQIVLGFLLCGFSFAHKSSGQDILNKTISLNVENTEFKKVLTLIEKQANVHFLYSSSAIGVDHKVTMKVSDKKLEWVLNELVRPLSITYVVSENRILLKNEKKATGSLTTFPNEPAMAKVVDRTITGKVSGEEGEGLPGVSILVKGTQKGTTTDQDGNFRLSVADDQAVLVFSFVGYLAQEIPVGNQTTLNITLVTDTKALNEVVVVGYGTQKKSDVTGAVGSVKMDQEINSRPVVEVGQALYGKIPGVQVLASNGRPGTSSSIQIRGINSVSASSSPLIVVDGMPLPTYDMNILNSTDVESIEILKDASSAAIYGSRGANGVILITTKSGKEGKTKFNLNYTYGVQRAIDKIDVMNSAEYAQASIDAAQNGWIESGGDPNAPNTIEARKQYKYTWPTQFDTPGQLIETDWQDEIFRTSPMQKIDLNASGGNAKSNFTVSGGYVNQQGIVLTSAYQKYTFSVKAVTKVRDWLEVGGTMSLSYDKENEPFNRIVEWAVQYPSVFPVFGTNGYLGGPATTPGFEKYDAILFRPKNGHPLYRINDDIQHKRFNTLGNVHTAIDILPGLRFRTALNFYYRRVDDSDYFAVDPNMGPTYYNEGSMTVGQDRILNYTSQNLLTYDKSFGDHTLSVLGGMEYNNNDYYSTTQQRRGYDNDLIHALSAGRTVFQATDDISKSVLISYFSRVNYNFKGKYLLSTSIRRDGSSRFGPNNKWGVFPSISGGWIVSDEAFMKSRIINNLKLRASYGFTGNDRFADYRWVGTMAQGRISRGNSLSTTYYPGSITNPDLEWERTQQMNLGFDLGLLNNRITLEADYYISKSDGLLLDVPVPTVSGFTSVFKNIGKLQNKGLELNLTTHNLSGRRLSWSTQFNYSHNRNKILALGVSDAPMILQSGSGMETINKIGEPIFSFYGFKYLGVYKNQAEIDSDPSHYASATPGDGRYADINGDGVLNADDRTIIGKNTPDFIWGITNNLKYGGFDFSFLVQGVQGNDVYDNNILRSMLYHEGRNYAGAMVNRWRSEAEPGDGYHYKLTVNLDGYEKTASSYWIVDGSYFRLKSITAGYTFTPAILSKLRLQSLRVYANGLNLLTKKNSLLFDPENFNGGGADRRGISHSPYPTSKIITFGINIGF